jgi:HPt (histidine-containing phosphotransfer) domain-containing protein
MEISPQIRARFYQNRKHDLEMCNNYFLDENYSAIEMIAHKIKGNGAIFGHPELSEIGRDLELAVRAQDQAGIKRLLEKFAYWQRGLPS